MEPKDGGKLQPGSAAAKSSDAVMALTEVTSRNVKVRQKHTRLDAQLGREVAGCSCILLVFWLMFTSA